MTDDAVVRVQDVFASIKQGAVSAGYVENGLYRQIRVMAPLVF
jgi:hypothetical protein